MIEIKKVLDGINYPIIDFVLSNPDRNQKLLSGFVLNIHSYRINRKPAFSGYIKCENVSNLASSLQIGIHNIGWGKAENVRISLGGEISEIFPTAEVSIEQIIPDESRIFLTLEPSSIKQTALKKQIAAQNKGISEEEDKVTKLRITGIDLLIEHEYEGRTIVESIKVSTRREEVIYLGIDGFEEEYHHILYRRSFPQAVYYASITGSDTPKKSYDIFHKLEANSIDHFSIVIGSNKSCRIELDFEFLINGRDSIRSEKFILEIWNPQDSGEYARYVDGDELISSNQSKNSNSWELAELKKSGFPFHQRNSLKSDTDLDDDLEDDDESVVRKFLEKLNLFGRK